MRLLIDTQSFIWFFEADKKLPLSIRAMMEDAKNELAVSIVSFWEITVKMSLQKLNLSTDIETLINKSMKYGFETISIEPIHLITLSALDFYHRDPFDRMIIAQAIAEHISIISSDSIFKSYPVNCIW
ncbi:MAG: type II toxin-antitoxin system VapC family toxin [Prevotellaceae bacterium]|jgi:PIN domain nuclease of toxin-antitoxin system|nr:type II toxin-antitoxin system VapC family toxin [Prevotellaceae bacterium]